MKGPLTQAIKLPITAITELSSDKLLYGCKTGLKAIPGPRNVRPHTRDHSIMQIDQHGQKGWPPDMRITGFQLQHVCIDNPLWQRAVRW